MTKENVNLAKWRSMMNEHWSAVNMNLDLIKYPVITEKTYLSMFKNRQYTFDVSLNLTKPQIKKLFETLFSVNIVRINTLIPPKKSLRFAMSSGFKPSYKRVILTLKKDQSINFDLKDGI